MTGHNTRLLDIYTDYLLSSFGATTATGLSQVLPEVSHDAITRFLGQAALGNAELWKVIKPIVRRVERADAVLALDDTIQEKCYTDESELMTWHYDHNLGRVVKGFNLLSALYVSGGVSVPLGFELVQKTQLTTDPRSGKDKWVCPTTKNEMARALISDAVQKQIAFRYVLADLWFACCETMVHIKESCKREFVFPLKSNRRVALSLDEQKRGFWRKLSELELEPLCSLTLYLEGVPFPLRVSCQLFKNGEGAEGTLILCSSDLSLAGSALFEIYHKRWKVEEYHKSLKSNAGLAKSPTKLPHTQQNHIFASLVAFTKLETYRTQTHLNHFALKAKLYQSALESAWEQLRLLKQTHTPNPYHTPTA